MDFNSPITQKVILNNIQYELVIGDTDENNRGRPNLECYFKPLEGASALKNDQEYWTFIDIIRKAAPMEWQEFRAPFTLSDNVIQFGHTTQMRLVRWAQLHRMGKYAVPGFKELTQQYGALAAEGSKLFKEYPAALNDMRRQNGPLQWAVQGKNGSIDPKSLWLLTKYGRLNNSDSVSGSKPNVHIIENKGTYCEGRILEGNDFTITQHFNAALEAAHDAALDLLTTRDPVKQKIVNPSLRGGIKPDRKQIYIIINGAAISTFYCNDGRRLSIPVHIANEITERISEYTSALTVTIGSKKGGDTLKAIQSLGRPNLPDKLKFIKLWPAPPPANKKERGDRMEIAKAYGKRRRKGYLNPVENEILNPYDEKILQKYYEDDQDDPLSLSRYMAREAKQRQGQYVEATPDNEYIDLYSPEVEPDFSAVTGLDWNELGNYEWAEPTPEDESIIITLKDIVFSTDNTEEGKALKEEVKQRGKGTAGIRAMRRSNQITALFNAAKFIRPRNTWLCDDKPFKRDKLIKAGFSVNNLKAGIEYGYISQIASEIYIFALFENEDYIKFLSEESQKQYRIIDATEAKNETAMNTTPFNKAVRKKYAAQDNLIRQGLTPQKAEKAIKEQIKQKEQEEAKKTFVRNRAVVKANVVLTPQQLLDKAKADGTLTPELELKYRRQIRLEEEKARLKKKQEIADKKRAHYTNGQKGDK